MVSSGSVGDLDLCDRADTNPPPASISSHTLNKRSLNPAPLIPAGFADAASEGGTLIPEATRADCSASARRGSFR